MEITLALLRAGLAGTDFSRPSLCCALRRRLKSLILLLPCFYFLFASCLRQPGAHGLEFVTTFSPHDLLFVPMVQLPRTFPFEQPAASRVQWEPKEMFALQGHIANEAVFI